MNIQLGSTGIIKNRDYLATTKLRAKVLNIIEAGIASVLPTTVMKSAVSYDLRNRVIQVQNEAFPILGRIVVVGGGKAAGFMAETLESIIGPENIIAGVVTCNCKKNEYKTSKIKIVEAVHPVPDNGGLKGVQEMLALRKKYRINKDDTVICLLSGGASALMPCPADGISIIDKQNITGLLLSCGAEIREINAVRKHLSKTKGGRLGRYFSPAKMLSLIISDVVGNDLSVIASGPTFPDISTFTNAYRVLSKYGLLSQAPKNVMEYLAKGCRGEVEETPKTLKNCQNIIIGDNRMALIAMESKAKEMGLSPHIITAEEKGDTAAVACLRAEEIKGKKYAGYNLLLSGGETTPKLPDVRGKGGRNQHYAAVSVLAMKDYPRDWVVASVGTDGSDFLANIAGGIVDRSSCDRATFEGIDIEAFINRYDSHTLLKKIEHSIMKTGNTGTNVGDVIVYALG